MWAMAKTRAIQSVFGVTYELPRAISIQITCVLFSLVTKSLENAIGIIDGKFYGKCLQVIFCGSYELQGYVVVVVLVAVAAVVTGHLWLVAVAAIFDFCRRKREICKCLLIKKANEHKWTEYT